MNGYSYDDLLQQLATFPSVHAVGRSAFGRAIWCIRVGSGKGGALVHGAIHAREHITAPVVVAMAMAYSRAYRRGMPPMDFVPMVNPDGVQLCLGGLDTVPPAWRRALAAINGGTDFALWKANGQGVDPNTNFDAHWGRGAGNVHAPAPAGYVGAAPACCAETRALVRLTQARAYTYTLAYHCKGEVVYYGFGMGRARHHSRAAALDLAAYLGYTPATSVGSCGGYKDWYALHYPRGVALTVEIGRDDYDHPYPYHQLAALVQQHRTVPHYIAQQIQERL